MKHAFSFCLGSQEAPSHSSCSFATIPPTLTAHILAVLKLSSILTSNFSVGLIWSHMACVVYYFNSWLQRGGR